MQSQCHAQNHRCKRNFNHWLHWKLSFWQLPVQPVIKISSKWRHFRLFGRRSRKTSKLRVTGLCAGNSPVTVEFPSQMASNAENVSIGWRHHGLFPFVAVVEGFSSLHRIHASMLINLAFPMSGYILVPIAYFVRDFRHLQLYLLILVTPILVYRL